MVVSNCSQYLQQCRNPEAFKFSNEDRLNEHLVKCIKLLVQGFNYSNKLTATDKNVEFNYELPDETYSGRNLSFFFNVYQDNQKIVVDAFIPEYKVAIDYKAEYHYLWTWLYGPSDRFRVI